MDDELRQIYNDPNINTSSAKRLYQAVKDKDLKVTMAQVKDFIEKQGAFQKTKTFKAQRKLFSSIVAPRPGSNLQIDLMELRKRYKLKGKPKSYVLNVVDIHSRKAWSVPLPKKTSKGVTAAMRKILDEIARDQTRYRGKTSVVKNINSDNGTEFTSDVFQKLLRDRKINHYMSDPKDYAKNAIVERFNRTLRRIMLVDKTQRGGTPFTPDDIERYAKNYNMDVHSTIKAKPELVYQLKEKNQQKYVFPDFKLKNGDRVRTLNKNALFDKGTYEYSDKVYTIVRKEKNRYVLDGLKKKFMGYELLLVKDVQEAPGYDVVLAQANREAELQDEEQERTERAMNREGLEPAAESNVSRKRRAEVPKVGRRIQVAWGKNNPITKSARDKTITSADWHTGKVVSSTGSIKYDDDGKTYKHNFGDRDASRGDFIERRHWRYL